MLYGDCLPSVAIECATRDAVHSLLGRGCVSLLSSQPTDVAHTAKAIHRAICCLADSDVSLPAPHIVSDCGDVDQTRRSPRTFAAFQLVREQCLSSRVGHPSQAVVDELRDWQTGAQWALPFVHQAWVPLCDAVRANPYFSSTVDACLRALGILASSDPAFAAAKVANDLLPALSRIVCSPNGPVPPAVTQALDLTDSTAEGKTFEQSLLRFLSQNPDLDSVTFDDCSNVACNSKRSLEVGHWPVSWHDRQYSAVRFCDSALDIALSVGDAIPIPSDESIPFLLLAASGSMPKHVRDKACRFVSRVLNRVEADTALFRTSVTHPFVVGL
ncbi:hypothetical protein KIPB_009419, partial [Kipferlia bialata]|eukprot:g9419.t1